MLRVFLIFCFLSFFSLSIGYGQSDPKQEVPALDGKKKNGIETKNTKEIKSVSTSSPKGAKPAKISSAARPTTIRPNQPVNTRKVPVKGKPSNTGKPSGN